MRESVCIILNERESSKAKAAEALVSKLKPSDITVSRLPVTSDIQAIVLKRLPKIIVLDYLLGDYTTGLDIMYALQDVDEASRPKTFFLTDEPSVPVAVEAMRLGAINYFELENPESVNQLAQEITTVLKNERKKPPLERRAELKLTDLATHAEASLVCMQNARATLAKHAPLTILYGEPGSGLTTWANALQHEHTKTSYPAYVDLAVYSGDCRAVCYGLTTEVQDVSKLSSTASEKLPLRLGENLSLIIDHLEEDDGELLNFLADRFKKLWPSCSGETNNSYFIGCTTSAETAKAWEKLTQAEVLHLPALHQRKEDIPPLVQRFVRDAEEYSKEKIKPFNGELVTWLAGLEWRCNLRQLRSVVMDAAIASTFSESAIKDLLAQGIEHWNETHNLREEPLLPDKITAASMLELYKGSYRVAAAHLGCGIKDLQRLIRGSSSQRDSR